MLQIRLLEWALISLTLVLMIAATELKQPKVKDLDDKEGSSVVKQVSHGGRLNNKEEEEKEEEEAGKILSRAERYMSNNEAHIWTKGIVPYVMKPGTETKVHQYYQTMAAVEANSCVRFVPWNNGTAAKKYGIDHPYHLNFINDVDAWNCYSYVGMVWWKQGQNINCCGGDTCMHEIGHALSFSHEHHSSLKSGWVRFNYNTMLEKGKGEYSNTYSDDYHNPANHKRFPYDAQSIMHYGSSESGAMTMLFPELGQWDYKGRYYFFMEIADTYKCHQHSPCDGRLLNCVNDGYTTLVNGKCQCQCPRGLDSETLCEKPLKRVKTSWPKGQYGLPKPKTGCPSDEFVEGSVYILDITAKKSGSPMLAGTYNDLQIVSEFCLRTSDDGKFKTEEEESFNWPTGHFCIFKMTNTSCPFGFEAGNVYYGVADHGAEEGPLPAWMYEDTLSLRLCCQIRDLTTYKSELPLEKPFSLYKHEDSNCQQITGTKVEKEEIKFYGEGFKADGALSESVNKDGTENTIGICHYTPRDMNCGDGIVLDELNNETVVEFDSTGREDVECTWVVRGDTENGTLVLDFIDMNVREENSKCKDRIEVAHSRIGHKGLDYCGTSLKHSIRSITNKLLIRFFTNGKSSSSFKARIRWVPYDQLCYDASDKGVNYDGKVNYTRTFEPCLPWSQMTECNHHPFTGEELTANLEGNYCRNPDNSFRPWCYTDTKYCRRNYCDVCGIETSYDQIENCQQLKQNGFCSGDVKQALKYCAATCKKEVSPIDAPRRYNEIQCSPPIPPEEGDIIGPLKSNYIPGDKIEIKCKTKDSNVSSTCMTSGSWTEVTGSCMEECPINSQYKNSCFRLQKLTDVSFLEAEEICRKVNGFLPVPKSTEETKAILAAANGHKFWLGINDKRTEGEWVDEDGSKIVWFNWKKGEPKHRRGSDDCAKSDKNGGWEVDNCQSDKKRASTVCQVPLKCNDQLGRKKCEEILNDNPEICDKFSQYCRKTCGICNQAGQHRCSIQTTNDNVEIVTNSRTLHILPGEFVKYACKRYTYKHSGNELRACLPDGTLTGERLECDECPLGYKSTDTACHGFASHPFAFSFTFDEARSECSKVSGYVAMPKSPAENRVISAVGLGAKIWLGVGDDAKEGRFVWDDGSLLGWNNFEGKPEKRGPDCVMMDENMKWVNVKCGNRKLTTVCTIPKQNKFACYDPADKGVTYRGNVNVTKSGYSCLPWIEIPQCNVNQLQPANEFILENNLCRNTDGSDGPWCYYSSSCRWQLCDVCNKQIPPSDKRADCGKLRDSGFCTKDADTATAECGTTCSDLLLDFGQGNFRTIQCKRPSPPTNAIVVDQVDRAEYKVGDQVRLKCRSSNFFVDVTCLTSGDWSEAGEVCTKCPLGYVNANGTCYGWFDLNIAQPQAEKKCAEMGGTLPFPSTMEDNAIIAKFSNGEEVWLGAQLTKSRDVLINNGSKAKWLNWADEYPSRNYLCLFMKKDGKWANTRCDYIRGDMTVLCTVPMESNEVCGDFLDRQCPQMLERNPNFCEQQKTLKFAQKYCRKTCNFCTSKDGVSKCDVPIPNHNGVSVNTNEIAVGEYVTYSCDAFIMYPTNGDEKRACLSDGTLTGSPLTCGKCPKDAVLKDGICYTGFNHPNSFSEAKEQCAKLNGKVAYPKSEDESSLFISLAGAKFGEPMWIGLTDSVTDGTFLSEHGSIAVWQNWKRYEPNKRTHENCVEMGINKKWIRAGCGYKRPYVCSTPVAYIEPLS